MLYPFDVCKIWHVAADKDRSTPDPLPWTPMTFKSLVLVQRSVNAALLDQTSDV